MVMKKIKISEFKAKISAYLKEVQKGREFLITDRNLPVAHVSPIYSSNRLNIIHAESSMAQILKNLPELTGEVARGLNSSDLLRADRDKR
jgi:prevent-host-death family protein